MKHTSTHFFRFSVHPELPGSSSDGALVLSGQGPTILTSFNLNHFLRGHTWGEGFTWGHTHTHSVHDHREVVLCVSVTFAVRTRILYPRMIWGEDVSIVVSPASTQDLIIWPQTGSIISSISVSITIIKVGRESLIE